MKDYEELTAEEQDAIDETLHMMDLTYGHSDDWDICTADTLEEVYRNEGIIE